MIPEAAVEAAARAIAEGLRTKSIADLARLALEAAAQHMLPLGPHPKWSSEVSPANNAHIAYCPQCQANFGGAK